MWWGSEGPGQVLKQHPHTLPVSGRREPEYLPQSNSEEDESRDRRQRETPQRQGACCRHGLHNAGTERCEREPGFYQGAFCVRAKGEWEGWRATTPRPTPRRGAQEQALGFSSCRTTDLLEMGLG